MSNINYQIVLFKNNKKKKIIKSFVTLDNAKIFYNKKINEPNNNEFYNIRPRHRFFSNEKYLL